MGWYYHIALVLLLIQVAFLLQTYRNYRYVLAKYKKSRSTYRPRTTLIVPCKGLDTDFEKNIASFFSLDYDNYSLWFVVSDKEDPAYSKLCVLRDEFSHSSMACGVKVFVAGQTQACSQKIHNLLYCVERVSNNVEVMAFADSDICVRSDWLSHLVYPLRKPKYGAASGYRWFVPKKNNPATLALSAINAKIAQLLGNTRFNQAWGGSMAIRRDVFGRVGLGEIWPKALSDDLSLTGAVKAAGLKIAFVPACLVASHDSTDWKQLFEFGRRQFLITRIYAPQTWWFGLFSSLFSVVGLWGTAVLAVYAGIIADKRLLVFVAVPVLFFASQMFRAVLRQKMIKELLKAESHKMRLAMAADIFFFWAWSFLLLCLIITSAFGRTITWRGIRYKLIGPTETVLIG